MINSWSDFIGVILGIVIIIIYYKHEVKKIRK